MSPVHTLSVIVSGAVILATVQRVQPHVALTPVRLDPTVGPLVLGMGITYLMAVLVACTTAVVWTWLPYGALVISGSLWLRRAAIQALGVHFSYGLQRPTRIVTTGPYRVLAHPAYVGTVGIHVGLGVFWGAPWAALVFLIGLGGLFTWRARIETRDYVRGPEAARA